jgi:hypothetical protein
LILRVDILPRIAQLLFEPQAYALLFAINVQHHHVDVLADLEDFRRVPDAAPTHIGDVEQAVNAIEVNERAEVGDILDGALADVARGHFRQELAPLVVALLLDQFAAGENNVLALLVDLDDFKFVGVADELGQVLGRNHVDLRGGQKSLHADVDQQTTLDGGLDLAGDGAAFVANGEDFIPILFEFGLFLGEDDHALFVFQFLDQDIDFIADFDRFDVVEFVAGDDPFTFVADIDEDFFGTDFNDFTCNNLACGKASGALLQGFFHREHNNSDDVRTNCAGDLAGTPAKTPLPT